MPLTAKLTAGNLKGWGPKPDEDIQVWAVQHEVENPVNPTDGSRGAKRLHTPFTITKRIDQSTPFFHEYQKIGGVIDPCKIHFIHNPPKGKAANYLTVELHGAKVVGIKTVMPRNSIPALAMVHEYEEISFAYTKIVWIEEKVKNSEGPDVFQAGTATASDDKDAGLVIAVDDWVEEEARSLGLKMIAELEQKGIKYGETMYEDMVAKFKELLKPPAPPEKK